MTDNNNLAKGDAWDVVLSPPPLFPRQDNEKAYEGVLSHNSYKFNALFKKSTTFCICFQLELHFLLAHKKLLTFSIRSQLLLLFLRYIKK